MKKPITDAQYSGANSIRILYVYCIEKVIDVRPINLITFFTVSMQWIYRMQIWFAPPYWEYFYVDGQEKITLLSNYISPSSCQVTTLLLNIYQSWVMKSSRS